MPLVCGGKEDAACSSGWLYQEMGDDHLFGAVCDFGANSSLACLCSLSRTHLKAWLLFFFVGPSYTEFPSKTLAKLLRLFRIVSGNTVGQLRTLYKMLILPFKHPAQLLLATMFWKRLLYLLLPLISLPCEHREHFGGIGEAATLVGTADLWPTKRVAEGVDLACADSPTYVAARGTKLLKRSKLEKSFPMRNKLVRHPACFSNLVFSMVRGWILLGSWILQGQLAGVRAGSSAGLISSGALGKVAGWLAGLVAGQHGPEARLERLQQGQHCYHLSHVCCADGMRWLTVPCGWEVCQEGKNALLLVC